MRGRGLRSRRAVAALRKDLHVWKLRRSLVKSFIDDRRTSCWPKRVVKQGFVTLSKMVDYEGGFRVKAIQSLLQGRDLCTKTQAIWSTGRKSLFWFWFLNLIRLFAYFIRKHLMWARVKERDPSAHWPKNMAIGGVSPRLDCPAASISALFLEDGLLGVVIYCNVRASVR
ncbi:hypothetical protein EV356DRAFT_364412 [Viridothelium virens]|uniref:Uncharacterized protein n=1 Tax=Viridothelium virens TaxID=1048519 RepID=A0A6A6GW72_VIRVR|nr:hypothetical protein EV356DRAFT_364412 [Viridothelium virens]